MIVCSSPACQTTAGCKCVWPWQHRQVPSYTAAGTQYVIPPERPWEHQIASVICGHPFIQKLEEYDQDTFELFVREVIRTNARR